MLRLGGNFFLLGWPKIALVLTQHTGPNRYMSPTPRGQNYSKSTQDDTWRISISHFGGLRCVSVGLIPALQEPGDGLMGCLEYTVRMVILNSPLKASPWIGSRSWIALNCVIAMYFRTMLTKHFPTSMTIQVNFDPVQTYIHIVLQKYCLHMQFKNWVHLTPIYVHTSFWYTKIFFSL